MDHPNCSCPGVEREGVIAHPPLTPPSLVGAGLIREETLARESEPARGIRARLISGVCWTTLFAVFSQGSTFLATVAFARVLGQEPFGKLGMLQSLASSLAVFAGLGLGLTATKSISELRGRDSQQAGRMLGSCLLVTTCTGLAYSLGLLVLAPWVAADLLGSADLELRVRIIAIAVFFLTMNGYQVGALLGLEAFSCLAWLNCVLGVVTVLLSLVLPRLAGLTGAVGAVVLTAVVSWVLHQGALRRACRREGISVRFDNLGRVLPALRTFTLPAALSGLMGGLAILGANAILVRQENGFVEIAAFTAATTLRTMVMFVPAIVSRVSAPVLCSLRARNDLSGYRRTLRVCLLFNSLVTGIAGMLCYWGAPHLFGMFGRDFVGSPSLLLLLLLGALAETLAVAWYQTVLAHGKIWTHFAVTLPWSALLLGMTWWGAARYGALALAAAYLVGWSSAAVLYRAASRRLDVGASGPDLASPGCRQERLAPHNSPARRLLALPASWRRTRSALLGIAGQEGRLPRR